MNMMKSTMNKLLLAFSLSLIFGVNAAWALDLTAAKNQGLAGETPSGYLEAVNNPSVETKGLLNRINTQRREKYKSIAQQNGTTITAVEQLAGEKAINMTKPGNFIKTNGNWVKK